MIMAAGEPHGIRLFGGHALNSPALDKNFGTWAREFRPIYGPYEAGLGPFVKLESRLSSAGTRRQERSADPNADSWLHR